VRPDAIIGTGRSDYPNQVNNVLCFPFIFRGALDVGATTINEEMKLACVRALADLAMAEQNEVVASAYGGDQDLSFGPEYVIPKPFDPRLIVKIAPAVAQAAMDSGVATRPIADMDAYIEQLAQFVYKTNLFMKPVFTQAKKDKKRVVMAEGEDERVLHATQEIASQGLAFPILIGRPSVIEKRIEKLGLKLQAGVDFELVNNESDPRFNDYWTDYYNLMKRKGVSQEQARRRVIGNTTLIGALMVRRGEADAMICGTYGTYRQHFDIVENVIGYAREDKVASAMNALILPTGNIFIADTYVNANPDAGQLGNSGYAFANVNAVPEVDKEKRQVAFTFFVDPGRRVYVRRINVAGNTRTRDEVIRREMRQMESGWYDNQKIKRSKERLDLLGYFTDVNVETPAVTDTPDQVDVNVSVTEKPTGSVQLGAGFSQDNGFALSASISQTNFFGSGKAVSAGFNTDKVNEFYNLSFTDPYFTVDGTSLGYDVYRKTTTPARRIAVSTRPKPTASWCVPVCRSPNSIALISVPASSAPRLACSPTAPSAMLTSSTSTAAATSACWLRPAGRATPATRRCGRPRAR
jgi:hypothetical protein